MKIDIKVEGIGSLVDAFDTEKVNERLKKAVAKNSADLHRRASRKVPVDTGFLRRSILPPSFSSDGLYAIVRATADYAPYVEFGTRFMTARAFMAPAYNEIRQQFLDDVRKAMMK